MGNDIEDRIAERRLAEAGLGKLTDEGRQRVATALTEAGYQVPPAATPAELVEALADLERDRAAAEIERDAARTELAEANAKIAELETAIGDATKIKIDALLEAAYRDGKLIRARDADGAAMPSLREQRLRRIAKEHGIEALAAELADLPVIVPSLGRGVLGDDPSPREAIGPLPTTVLAAVAEQLDLDPTELAGHHAVITGGGES